MISLARHVDPKKIRWTGTALTSWGQSDPLLSSEMRRHMPIFAARPRGRRRISDPYITALDTSKAAFAAVARSADVIISWGTSRAGALAKDFGCKVIFVSHSSFPFTKEIRPEVLEDVHLVAVSEAAVRPFHASLRDRVTVIHNGVESERCIQRVGRSEVRAQWGLNDAHKVIGYVGRPALEKNPLALARAVAHLGGDYCAVYVGCGSQFEKVQTLASMIAGSRVKFVPPMEQVGDALAAMDAFVLASPSEGFSLALTEAWLAGVPTVATRVGAIPELERVHGQLVVPLPVRPTATQLASSIESVFRDDNREIVGRAQRLVENQFTAVAMSHNWLEYLHDIA